MYLLCSIIEEKKGHREKAQNRILCQDLEQKHLYGLMYTFIFG